jgi:hypothetical protein
MSTLTTAFLAVAACIFTGSVALGQGTVGFRNQIGSQSQFLDVPFFDEKSVRLEGSNYVAQLYYWTNEEGFRPAAGNPLPFSTNGYFYGTVVYLLAPECGSAWVQVRAWAVAGGPSFEEAALAGAWTGVSSILFLNSLGSPSRPENCGPPALVGLKYPGNPVVVQAPQSRAVLPGEAATLSVIASTGVAGFYQWYQEPSSSPDGLIPGATNATYNTPPVLVNTTYWVAISNSAGSTLSAPATLTVLPSAPRLGLERADGLSWLTLDAAAGFDYRIDYATNLDAPAWTPLLELELGTTPFRFTDSAATNAPVRFYRAVAP